MCALGAASSVAGCGGGPSTSSTGGGTTTTASKQAGRRSEPPRIAVTIPVLVAKGILPARYTCYGANESPPIQWGPVPAGTTELAVFVSNVIPVHEKYLYDWAVTGLKPTLHGIPAAKLPAGAVVGRNSFGRIGYTMCLLKGRREENAVVDLFALPHSLAAKPGFDAEAVANRAGRSAKNGGIESWVYMRP